MIKAGMSYLSDGMVQRLLGSSNTPVELPEFKPYVTAMQNIRMKKAGRCGSCAKRRLETTAVQGARRVLLSLVPDRLATAKRIMGVDGHELRVYFRNGTKVETRIL